MFRIQKLMIAEFPEIYEPIIVENPFTQVSENGRGLRQYHIGLTTTKIIFGCDDFDVACMQDIYCNDIDPEIQTFQLVSLIPLQFIRLQFYRKKNREVMKMSFLEYDEEPLYFEFGGYVYRNLFWNTWRERIATLRLMDPKFANITNASPFCSTDVIPEEVSCKVLIHSEPRVYSESSCVSVDFSNYP